MPVPRRGTLSRFGYKAFAPSTTRRRALTTAVNAYGYQGTVGHLNLLANLTKRSQPATHRRYRADMAWLKTKYRQ